MYVLINIIIPQQCLKYKVLVGLKKVQQVVLKSVGDRCREAMSAAAVRSFFLFLRRLHPFRTLTPRCRAGTGLGAGPGLGPGTPWSRPLSSPLGADFEPSGTPLETFQISDCYKQIILWLPLAPPMTPYTERRLHKTLTRPSPGTDLELSGTPGPP